MSVTCETFQSLRSRLKERAKVNMLDMSSTCETSHPERGLLNSPALWNMEIILVTLETSHPERSPLKSPAPWNMPDMSVTPETFHEERSPLKSSAKENMESMSVTLDRSGASVARYSMLEAPRNADSIVVHSMSPHCSMDCSFGASGEVKVKRIFSRPPVMLIVWVPGVSYACVALLDASSEDPSPQITEYVPVPGMVISSSSLVVIHVVMNAEPVSFTVTTISSDPESVPSSAVSVRVKVASASTAGAVKVVEAEESSANVMPEPDGADQEYDSMESPASGSVADPDRVTVSPSPTVWSGPAATTGGLLPSGDPAPVTVISSSRQLLPFSKTPLPEAVTMTV